MLAQSTTVAGAGGDAAGQETGQEPAQRHPGARIDADDLPAAVEAGDLDLVGPDEPGPLEVDEVAGQQVLDEQQLARAAVEALQVDGVAHHLDASGTDVGDALDGNEERSLTDADDETRERGMGGVAQPDDQVLDPAQAVPVAVDERALHHARQVKDLDGHASVLLEQRRYPRTQLTGSPMVAPTFVPGCSGRTSSLVSPPEFAPRDPSGGG
jgi:hypothetical protein